MKMTFLELAQKVLDNEKKPLTALEIWELAKSKIYGLHIISKSKTPWVGLEARLYIDVRQNPSSVFGILHTNPKSFVLKKHLEIFDTSDTRESVKKLIYSAVHILLSNEKIQLDEITDLEKIKKLVDENPELFESVKYIAVFHDEFVDAAKDAFKQDKHIVGIVLLATAVEQMLNTDYRDLLGRTGLFSESEITEIIRNNNVGPKIGWLLTLVSGYELDSNLKSRILKLMELRNQIVHYKATPPSKDSKQPTLWQQIKSVDVDDLLSIPNELYEVLGEVLEGGMEIHDEVYMDVKQAVDILFQSKKK